MIQGRVARLSGDVMLRSRREMQGFWSDAAHRDLVGPTLYGPTFCVIFSALNLAATIDTCGAALDCTHLKCAGWDQADLQQAGW